MTDEEKIQAVEDVLDRGCCGSSDICDGSRPSYCFCPVCKVCGSHLPLCFVCGAIQPHGWYCHD